MMAVMVPSFRPTRFGQAQTLSIATYRTIAEGVCGSAPLEAAVATSTTAAATPVRVKDRMNKPIFCREDNLTLAGALGVGSRRVDRFIRVQRRRRKPID